LKCEGYVTRKILDPCQVYMCVLFLDFLSSCCKSFLYCPREYLIMMTVLLQNSVNARYETIPYPWLVFGEKVKVNSVFIRDSTGVSDSVLILFGGALACGAQVILALFYG